MSRWEIFGIVLTIVSTAITIWQAIGARLAAKSAKEYRDEALLARNRISLYQLSDRAKAARDQALLLCKPANPSSRRGVNPDKILGEVRAFIHDLHEVGAILDDATLVELRKNADAELSAYPNCVADEDRYKAGESLRSILAEIVSLISLSISKNI